MPAIVTFDPTNLRIIEINTGSPLVNTISIREIYSEWKDWLLADPTRKGYPQAFRYVGADPVSDTEELGSTFFLLFPWKIRPAEYDHELILEGNIFTDPAGESPVVPTLSPYTLSVVFKVSTLVETTGGTALSPAETADAVWKADPTNYPLITEMGGKILGALASMPTDTRDAVWTAAASLYVDDTKMGGKILTDLAAILTALGSGVELSPTQTVQLKEVWQVLGLDPTNVLTVSKTARTAGTAVTQTIQEDVPVAGSVRVTKT